MEEKQLDFSQPILSVRRASSSPVVVKDYNRKPANVAKHPLCKPDQPEVKLGQVRVSGTVPFIWERSPGTPKNESSSAEPNSPAVPRLPPGRRRLNAKSIASEGSLSSPKAEEKSTDDDDSEEEEVRFLDAHDTLSRTESNGLDNARPNRTLSSDLQARDFVMGKFLPAAEAMASETARSQQHSPRYPTKKQLVPKEQARQFKTFSNKGDIFAYYGNNPVVVGDDHSEPDGSCSLRLCGLLPLCGNGKQPSRYRNKHSMDSFRMRCCPEMINVGGSAANKRWTHNNNGSKSPQVPFARKGEGFLGIPERYNKNLQTVGSILHVKDDDVSSFGELLLSSSESSTPVVEKILYMDDPVHDQDKTVLTTTEEDDSSKHEKFQSFGVCYLSFSDDDEEAQVDMKTDEIHPLSLPLPKSPSESWLKKALPTVPSSKPPLGVVEFSKSSPDVWKTIVKASNGKNMHFEFSEGKLKPIPEA